MYKTDKNLTEYSYKNIQDIESKRIILRSCLNVATDDEGNMTDPTRFYESLPLIVELSQKAKNLVVLGHLGRPEKREKKFSFKSIAENLESELEELNIGVELIEDLNLESIEMIKGHDNTKERKVFLLENVRFFKGEESKDLIERKNFAKTLAGLGDIFVNDAFADYRESASTYDIAEILPSFLGPVFLKEVEAIDKFEHAEKPFVAVLGGAKLSEKLDALYALAENADVIIIGGAMAYTLLKAKGMDIGKSLYEEDKLQVSKDIIEKYSDKILLPVDHMVATSFEKNAAYEYTDDTDIPDESYAIDIGWKTIEKFVRELRDAKSILWNGPMGVFEWDHSSVGTLEVGRAIQDNHNAYKMAGGGDSIAAINKLGLDEFNHISTGGGAMLALIAYDKFPTLDVIISRN